MSRHVLLPLAAALSLAAHAARAQQTGTESSDAAPQKATNLAPVDVNAQAWRETVKAKLEHMLPEVDATRITVTKKTTVTHLADQPTVIGNNLDQLLVRSPGVQVSQQPTPTQFNLSYRGLGNPQESEYVLVMQDGIPLESDW
ncbi:MAG: Plug domain-containing protein, partial [Rhodanobacter sp.]